VDCCAHHNFAGAIGNGVPFLLETAGNGDLAGRHFLAAKKPAVAARKIGAKAVAFGLPQDSRAELMFEPCETRAPCASASPRSGFLAPEAVAASGAARQRTATASIVWRICPG